MKKFGHIVYAVLVVVMMAVLPAFAQETNPCANDFKQYCADVTPSGGRLVRCFEERKDKMSAACVSWADLAKSNAATLKAGCAKEIDTRCSFEKGDPFATVDCLQGNYIDLSMGCREKLNEFKGRYQRPLRDQSQ